MIAGHDWRVSSWLCFLGWFLAPFKVNSRSANPILAGLTWAAGAIHVCINHRRLSFHGCSYMHVGRKVRKNPAERLVSKVVTYGQTYLQSKVFKCIQVIHAGQMDNNRPKIEHTLQLTQRKQNANSMTYEVRMDNFMINSVTCVTFWVKACSLHTGFEDQLADVGRQWSMIRC